MISLMTNLSLSTANAWFELLFKRYSSFGIVF